MEDSSRLGGSARFFPSDILSDNLVAWDFFMLTLTLYIVNSEVYKRNVLGFSYI